jgi:hydrogenase maturation protein HypF
MGRLFDAVSALLDICQEVTYEGQAAIQLEIASNQSFCRVYPYRIARDNNGAWEMDIRPLFAALLAGRRAGEPRGLLAGRFHRTVAKITAEICTRLRDEFALNRVALSGGVWQNLLLRKLALAELTRHGFEVFLPAQFPCNDGGLSLGQAVVAAARMGAGLSVGSVR